MPAMKIIALTAHPDDEIGCFATLAKHARRGDEVLLVWTTYGENASHFEGIERAEVKRVREGHGQHVADLIGAKYRFFDFGDTRVAASRAEALALARLYSEFQPDAIITWDDANPHPDHRATAKAAFDAITLARIPKVIQEGDTPDDRQYAHLQAHRKPITYYQYFLQESQRPVVHIDVTETVEIAADALEFYAKFYGWEFGREQFLAGRAATGRSVGLKYAERFNIKRGFHPPMDYLV
jgi:N-acetylglucosamine malate deacetylase 1